MEVYNQPQNQFVAGFIGSPPMNFLDTRLVSDNGGSAIDLQGLRLPLPPQQAKSAEAYTNKMSRLASGQKTSCQHRRRKAPT